MKNNWRDDKFCLSTFLLFPMRSNKDLLHLVLIQGQKKRERERNGNLKFNNSFKIEILRKLIETSKRLRIPRAPPLRSGNNLKATKVFRRYLEDNNRACHRSYKVPSAVKSSCALMTHKWCALPVSAVNYTVTNDPATTPTGAVSFNFTSKYRLSAVQLSQIRSRFTTTTTRNTDVSLKHHRMAEF